MYWFLLKAAVSGVFGSAFGKWFLSTKMGIWFQKHLDRFMEYLANKYNINIAKKELKWREQYPLLAERIDKLEEWSHPPVAPGGANELVEMIQKLEKDIEKLKKGKK